MRRKKERKGERGKEENLKMRTYHRSLMISVLQFVQQMLLYVLIKVLGIVSNQSLLSINQQILKYCKGRKSVEHE